MSECKADIEYVMLYETDILMACACPINLLPLPDKTDNYQLLLSALKLHIGASLIDSGGCPLHS